MSVEDRLLSLVNDVKEMKAMLKLLVEKLVGPVIPPDEVIINAPVISLPMVPASSQIRPYSPIESTAANDTATILFIAPPVSKENCEPYPFSSTVLAEDTFEVANPSFEQSLISCLFLEMMFYVLAVFLVAGRVPFDGGLGFLLFLVTDVSLLGDPPYGNGGLYNSVDYGR